MKIKEEKTKEMRTRTHKKNRGQFLPLTILEHMSSPPFVCVVLLCVFTFCVPCCGDRYDFRIKRCSVRLYLQLFVGGLMSYLRYLCLLAHSDVQHILHCGFV
jgi:hypothetical protein